MAGPEIDLGNDTFCRYDKHMHQIIIRHVLPNPRADRPFAASEVAGELAEKTDFGACYFEVAQGRWQYSLRSRGKFDVSEVAKIFGGGGHKGAAGFTVDAPVHRINT